MEKDEKSRTKKSHLRNMSEKKKEQNINTKAQKRQGAKQFHCPNIDRESLARKHGGKC